MGKIDDMRRQREERAAGQQKEHDARVRSGVAPGKEPAAIAIEPPRAAAPAAEQREKRNAKAKSSEKSEAKLEGKCSGCGKVRALVNGMVSNHQKGFGKMCPGSRKEPA